MKIACIQHVPFEGPANIANWAQLRGHTLQTTHVYNSDALPSLNSFDVLVVMGGPMSVNDAHLTYLDDERALIRKSADAGKHVLGVCLGAQLIAGAFGAPVKPGPHKEIGWIHVEFFDEAKAFGLPEAVTAFHWHGDVFAWPEGATPLGRSEGCAFQAFAIGERVLGLQFHIEATPQSVAMLVEHCGSEIGNGPYEQPSETMTQDPARFAAVEPVLFTMLDTWLGT